MENAAILVLIAARCEEDQSRILAALPEHMGFVVAGIVKDESGAIIKAESLKPDILVLDLQLSGIYSLDLIRIVRRRSPSTSIIMICNNEKEEPSADVYANHAIIAGLSGFLIKEVDMDKLAYAARIIFMGGFYINESVIVKIFSMVSFTGQYSAICEYSIFSPSERGIVTLLAQGFTDAQIACELNLSIGSIRNCMTCIRQKTKMKSRVEIILYSVVSGLIYPEHLRIWKEKRDSYFTNSRAEKTYKK